MRSIVSLCRHKWRSFSFLKRTAGFARVRYEGALAERAHMTAFRHWEEAPGNGAAPEVLCIENANTHGHDFSASRTIL